MAGLQRYAELDIDKKGGDLVLQQYEQKDGVGFLRGLEFDAEGAATEFMATVEAVPAHIGNAAKDYTHFFKENGEALLENARDIVRFEPGDVPKNHMEKMIAKFGQAAAEVAEALPVAEKFARTIENIARIPGAGTAAAFAIAVGTAGSAMAEGRPAEAGARLADAVPGLVVGEMARHAMRRGGLDVDAGLVSQLPETDLDRIQRALPSKLTGHEPVEIRDNLQRLVDANNNLAVAGKLYDKAGSQSAGPDYDFGLQINTARNRLTAAEDHFSEEFESLDRSGGLGKIKDYLTTLDSNKSAVALAPTEKPQFSPGPSRG